MLPESPPNLNPPARDNSFWIALAACLVTWVWFFWPAFNEMFERWWNDPQYTHCILVPFFSLFLLWNKRQNYSVTNYWPNPAGMLIVMVGIFVRFLGSYLFIQYIEHISSLIVLTGIVLFFFSWRGLRWAAPALIFLVFCVPLPYRVQNILGLPLQRFATVASTFFLQVFGIPAVADGNIISVNDMKIGVNEACNGLGMLITFFALSTAVAMISRRPGLDRTVVFLSAAPIAIVANIVRITATGIFAYTSGTELAKKVFHDFAGWLMMPLALAMLFFVLWYMERLLLDPRIFDHNKDVRDTLATG